MYRYIYSITYGQAARPQAAAQRQRSTQQKQNSQARAGRKPGRSGTYPHQHTASVRARAHAVRQCAGVVWGCSATGRPSTRLGPPAAGVCERVGGRTRYLDPPAQPGILVDNVGIVYRYANTFRNIVRQYPTSHPPDY